MKVLIYDSIFVYLKAKIDVVVLVDTYTYTSS